MMLRDVMAWLFPNGVGTRALLACIVVTAAVLVIEPAGLKELALLALGFYFGNRTSAVANGNGGNVHG